MPSIPATPGGPGDPAPALCSKNSKQTSIIY